MELYKYELSEEAKAQGLSYINGEDYQKTLSHLAEMKWDKLNETDLYKKRQKTAQFLLQKGVFRGCSQPSRTHALECLCRESLP